MRYYKNLYLSEGLEKKKNKIIDKLENKKVQFQIYVIVLSENENNHLEILQAVQLLQPDYPQKDMFVVGITASYEDALEIVEKILQEVYDKTKEADIRNYILKKEQEN